MSLVRITLALLVSIAMPIAATAQTELGKDDLSSPIPVGFPPSFPDYPVDSDSWAELEKTAKDIGLSGRWIVTSSEKDGEFSVAQIGQELGDLITTGKAGPARNAAIQVG